MVEEMLPKTVGSAAKIVIFEQKTKSVKEDPLAQSIDTSVEKTLCYSGTDYSGTTQSPPLKPQL